MEAHAVDPDKRRYAVVGEAENHYLDIDRYTHHADSISSVLPLYWDSAVAKFSEDTLRAHGIAPWNTYFVYAKLRKAFERKEVSEILRHATDLAHYVGDIHVPLHTTKNYNGQLTNQLGIHGFWETRLPELFWETYQIERQEAVYLNTPMLTIWQVVENAHQKVDSVLQIEATISKEFSEQKYAVEQRGNQEVRQYSEGYALEYADRLNGMVERQLQGAVIVLASLWYTAWVDAGQPTLDYSSETTENIEDLLENSTNEKSISVRPHE